MSKQNNAKCKKCETSFVYTDNECWWDEKGFGYSTKLTHCKECGCICIFNHKEDRWLDVNNDMKYYEYD